MKLLGRVTPGPSPSADRRQLAAQRGQLACLDQRRRAEIKGADIGENAYPRDNRRAQQPDHDDLQMGATVRAIDRVVYRNLRFRVGSGAAGPKM
jgi:hypothetical protein